MTITIGCVAQKSKVEDGDVLNVFKARVKGLAGISSDKLPGRSALNAKADVNSAAAERAVSFVP